MEKTLDDFLLDLKQEVESVINDPEQEPQLKLRENAFTYIFMNRLYDLGEMECGMVAYGERPRWKVNGYAVTEDDDRLEITLCISFFDNTTDEVKTLAPKEVKTLLDKLQRFCHLALHGVFADQNEEFDASDCARYLAYNCGRIDDINLVLLTNRKVRAVDLEPSMDEGDNVQYSRKVWDLERMYQVATSGQGREEVIVDFKELDRPPLECLRQDTESVAAQVGELSTSGNYTTYLTVIPGETLFRIYRKFKTRVLEGNIRLFLMTKGKVNRGIRETIQKRPEMFLAYNNGISVTAKEVEVTAGKGKFCTISKLRDFQIVNGGQTTASIYRECRSKKVGGVPSNLNVLAKITVVKDQKNLDEIVSNISRYANTQNKVQEADFFANGTFHKSIEMLSQSIWAPSKTAGGKRSKWFYERMRGQYKGTKDDAVSENQFESMYPNKFDKVQLARYENLWMGLPHITSKGGQASFRTFAIFCGGKAGKPETRILAQNVKYFNELVAKAILYRRTYEIVKSHQFKGYWANITDYSFAYFVEKTSGKLNLEKIWKNQDISTRMAQALFSLTKQVSDAIRETAGAQNVTQWCRQEACWNALKKRDFINVKFQLDSDDIDGNNQGFVYNVDINVPENAESMEIAEDGVVGLLQKNLLQLSMGALTPKRLRGLLDFAKEQEFLTAPQVAQGKKIANQLKEGRITDKLAIVSVAILHELYKTKLCQDKEVAELLKNFDTKATDLGLLVGSKE